MLSLSAAPSLGGFTEDAVDVLGPILGRQPVLNFVRGLETKIRTEAESGARKTIPDITLAVERRAKEAVKPYIIAAFAAAGVATAIGGFALYRTYR